MFSLKIFLSSCTKQPFSWCTIHPSTTTACQSSYGLSAGVWAYSVATSCHVSSSINWFQEMPEDWWFLSSPL